MLPALCKFVARRPPPQPHDDSDILKLQLSTTDCDTVEAMGGLTGHEGL
jgi:hypothetical protein